MLHQKAGEPGVVAGRLAADPRVGAALSRFVEKLGDSRRDGLVPLVKEAAQKVAVTVDTQDKLGQVVGSYREAVEAFGKALR